VSIHKDCGEHIHWFNRTDQPERYYPPMEFAGPVFVQLEGKIVETNAYRIHRCDPEKVVAWQEYLATMTELKGNDSFEGQISMHQAASEKSRIERYELAMGVSCDDCGANADEPCRNKSVLKKTGEIQETRYPHPSRFEKAWAIVRD